MTKPIYLAAVEGGGTTFLASIARIVSKQDSNTSFSIGQTHIQIVHSATFPPQEDEQDEWTPSQILSAVSQFFVNNAPLDGGYASLGIATFGPVGVSPSRHDYGCILDGCPKKEWRGVDVVSPLREACKVDKVGFDTDVNAPALAEFRHRCYLDSISNNGNKSNGSSSTSSSTINDKQQPTQKEQTSLAYITVGTGVGVGLILNSSPIHGLLHPEGGHCPIHTLPGDTFRGYSWGAERSPFRGVGTVEGVASSVALTERWLQNHNEHRGQRDHGVLASKRSMLASLGDDDEIWDHASNAIANLCATIFLLTSCQTIVLGGGVMNRTVLYGRVRKETLQLLNGYLDVEELKSMDGMERVIVGGSWEGVGSGLVGAFALALDCLECDNCNSDANAKDKMTEKGKSQFYAGLMTGIGLSLVCLFASKLTRRQ